MSIISHQLDSFRDGDGVGRARRAQGLLLVGVVALLVAGCRDSVAPTDRLAPTAAIPVLVGATTVNLLGGEESGTRADVRGLNDAGQATGSRFEETVGDWRPYRWTPGIGFVRLLGICCGTAWGADINNAGVVVGRAQTAVDEEARAFVAVTDVMVDLGLLPGASPELAGSDALAINDAGQIVGWANTAANPPARHAVLWSAAHVIHDLGTLGGPASTAVDINASGQVIGMSDVPAGGHRGFLWTSGAGMQDLVTLLGYPAGSVVAINDVGQIAGSYVAPGGDTHAFLYTPGSGLRDLGTLGGTTSTATGLNSQGDVVGSSTTAQGDTHAFLWTSTDGMEDVTVKTGFTAVRKLNHDLQTLSGGVFGAFPPAPSAFLVTLQVTLTWPFTGFAPPIDAAPAFNAAHAGHDVTLRFGLGGDRGLDIFGPGFPSSTEVSCATGAAIGSATPLSPTDFELTYQAGPDRYTLRWATDDVWVHTCRELRLHFMDGSTYVALFSFR
ncbi:MAG TPA: PxKF domain-containing protein [Gemmatimonadaceae bacterium]|nr:PxKF domain-containing protein [Gemmatimonadaceae bacterium]